MTDMMTDIQTTPVSRRRFLVRMGQGMGIVTAATASGLLGHALRQDTAGPSGAYGVGPMGGKSFAGKK